MLTINFYIRMRFKKNSSSIVWPFKFVLAYFIIDDFLYHGNRKNLDILRRSIADIFFKIKDGCEAQNGFSLVFG